MLRTVPSLLLALALSAGLAAPVMAGPAQSALLAKYAGSWSGSGKATGSTPGTVTCRLSADPTRSGGLGFQGRCTFSGQPAPVSFRGAIAYNDAAKRYEASTTGQGAEINVSGKVSGSTITFASADSRTSFGTVSSTMVLSAGTSIKISFKLTDRKGQATASSINFTKG